MELCLERVELVHDLKSGLFAKVIDAADIGQKIETQLLFSQPASCDDLIQRYLEGYLTAKIGPAQDLNLFLEFRSDFVQRHATGSSSAFAFFCSLIDFSSKIFS